MPLSPDPTAPTDFDFVIGDWNVKHSRLKERLAQSTEWIHFDGEMSTRHVMGGFGNIEDNILKFPDGVVRAAALRSYDAGAGTWSIWWLDGRFPGKLDVPVVGSFKDGVGSFYADDLFNGRPIRIRFLWSRCSDDQLRWEQAFSADNGATWETNWTMDFFRK